MYETKIVRFCSVKPRTIQEIAHFLEINWRTANKHVDKIAKESGKVAIRLFREGTRGSLKIVYTPNLDNIAGTQYQGRLVNSIIAGKKKEDFSPMDIYQYVDHDKRKAFITTHLSNKENEICPYIDQAKSNIYFFSGNMSWVHTHPNIIQALTNAAEQGIKIKIAMRIDIASMQNLNKLLAINQALGHDAIEIRHVEHPLRCILIDNKFARLKETKEPECYKEGELDNKAIIHYTIECPEWNGWLEKLFHKLYSQGTYLKKRLESLDSIQRL